LRGVSPNVPHLLTGTVKFQEVTKDDKRYRGTAESIELRDMAELEIGPSARRVTCAATIVGRSSRVRIAEKALRCLVNPAIEFAA